MSSRELSRLEKEDENIKKGTARVEDGFLLIVDGVRDPAACGLLHAHRE